MVDQLKSVNYYNSRRNSVLDILEEMERPLLLQEIKECYKKKYGDNMPFSNQGDANINEWLTKIDNIGTDFKNNQTVYFVKKPLQDVEITLSNENKRKTSSPIVSGNGAKRSRSMPNKEDQEQEQMPLLIQKYPQVRTPSRQSRSVKFKETSNSRTIISTRSKSESSQLRNAANIFGSLLIGDDFLLGLVVFTLHYNAAKQKGRLQTGLCVSGLTIYEAVLRVRNIQDFSSPKSALIYIGSIDIAKGRELIEMIQDFNMLMNICAEKNLRPVLCTLATMPNYCNGNRRDTILGFNKFLAENKFGLPVIDIAKCFNDVNSDIFLPYCYVPGAKRVSGFKKELVFWSKDGRDRAYKMIVKNLGLAIISSETILLSHM